MKTKEQLRKEGLLVRKGLSEQTRKRGSVLICDRIAGHQWFYQAKAILIYVSTEEELDTMELIQEALRLKKAVFVPKVTGKREMDFYRIDTLADLQEGFHGILEPAYDREIYNEKEYPVKDSLMIMPGVVFDPFNNRIGYGGGFYDAYLEKHPGFLVKSIAIGFKEQQVEEIITEKQDKKPYQVILV